MKCILTIDGVSLKFDTLQEAESAGAASGKDWEVTRDGALCSYWSASEDVAPLDPDKPWEVWAINSRGFPFRQRCVGRVKEAAKLTHREIRPYFIIRDGSPVAMSAAMERAFSSIA